MKISTHTACFTREEHPMHEVYLLYPSHKPYLSKCEVKDLSNFYSICKYLSLDMGQVVIKWVVLRICFMYRHQHLALKRDIIANVRMDCVDKEAIKNSFGY